MDGRFTGFEVEVEVEVEEVEGGEKYKTDSTSSVFKSSRPYGPGKVCVPRKPSKIKASLILTLDLTPLFENSLSGSQRWAVFRSVLACFLKQPTANARTEPIS